MADGVLQLVCECKHDPWGKLGKDSLAGQLWSHMPDAGELDSSKTYSEMWMGTYPTVPSRVLATGEPLLDHLKNNPHLVGESICRRYGPDIPFLPKILSFQKALPLQIHPDKTLAEQLHKTDPEKFGDTNHKPEIAIALSRFEAFVGFKRLDEIAELMRLKPLESIVPEHTDFNDEVLRQLCTKMLSMSPESVSDTITELQNSPLSEFDDDHRIPSLLRRLNEQYSKSDNGILVATLLMNYMILEPGEAICVPADSIHAYLSGDIMECMARSDNVLNTGFCPRPDRDDLELFAQALTFKPHSPEESILLKKTSQVGLKGRTTEYSPPISEFNVLGVTLPFKGVEAHRVIQSPSILVVTQGSGKMDVSDGSVHDISEGSVYFAAKDAELKFSTDVGLTLYRAYATF
ncbi:hypothetical protein N7507_010381 [Penicillium longicatenatum]|nr:hypothetical protein N7507_010381 [Penicillium longicatenatum]